MNDECEDVIRRIDGCQRIDPSHPATGLPGMSDDMWRACVDALRADGYPISSYITPEGKRGYFLGSMVREKDTIDLSYRKRMCPPIDIFAEGVEPVEDEISYDVLINDVPIATVTKTKINIGDVCQWVCVSTPWTPGQITGWGISQNDATRDYLNKWCIIIGNGMNAIGRIIDSEMLVNLLCGDLKDNE